MHIQESCSWHERQKCPVPRCRCCWQHCRLPLLTQLLLSPAGAYAAPAAVASAAVAAAARGVRLFLPLLLLCWKEQAAVGGSVGYCRAAAAGSVSTQPPPAAMLGSTS
jgi:hypothetical protein